VQKAIDFELPDNEGKTWRLADQLARGPVLLVFYRGDW
jgi:peroxiredoxin